MVYTHWEAGRTERQIARSLGMARNTVAKYLEPAKRAGLEPGGAPLGRERWAELAAGWFPDAAAPEARRSTWPQFEPHKEWVASQLAAGVRVSVVHQRLRDAKGVTASEKSLRRWIAANLPDARVPGARSPSAAMPPTGAGEVAQVDYGFMGRWEDPSGKTRNVNAFVMTLPYSKLLFVYPVVKMDQAAWSEAHVAAFEFYGGAPRRLVPDNLKAGVSKAGLYEPAINRAYRELAEYYGAIVDPARVKHPKDKPHVERMIQYVRGSWWRGAEFSSLAQMRADAERWCRETAGERAPRALDGRTANVVFEQSERPALLPLPARPFEVATWFQGKLGRDCHVRVDGCLYSAPFKLVGETLDARVTATAVELYAAGRPVKTHPRGAKGRRVTDFGDYPPQQAAFLVRDVAWCRRQAKRIGPATLAVVNALMEPYALHKLRSCQGIVHLADKHGAEAVEAAAGRALDVGDPTYRTVKGLLAAPPAAERPGGGGAGGILRGPAAFTQDELDWGDADEGR
jgi:transposase